MSILREAAKLAHALREDDAYIIALDDLSQLLMAPVRISAQDAAEALALMTEAIALTRKRNKPNLGLLLTNRAECRMRASRDRSSLLAARADLLEALPLRSTPNDLAYTLHNLGRALFLLPEEDPAVRIANLRSAVLNLEKAVEIFRLYPDEIRPFCDTVGNLAEVVERLLSLDRALSVTATLGASAESNEPPSSMHEVNIVYGLWNLAQINPSLVDDTDLAEALSYEDLPADNPDLVQTARQTLDWLTEVRLAEHRMRNAQWASAQFRSANLYDRLAGSVTMETARMREAGLDRCPMEEDPEGWCTWATAAMTSFYELNDFDRAIALGLRAVDAYVLAMDGMPDAISQRDLSEQFHYLGRRVAFLLLSVGDADRALAVLHRTRGRSRSTTAREDGPQEALELSNRWDVTLVYLVAGPESTFFLAVNGSSDWKTAVLHLNILGGKQLVSLLMSFSTTDPGLLGAQNINQEVLQQSWSKTFNILTPIMTAVHEWLEGLGCRDVALLPTGPYSLLPLISVPVQTRETTEPFGWLHRSCILPSAVSPSAPNENRAPLQTMLLAAEAIRPDLSRLRTRSECESIRSLAVANGWSARLLLGIDVTRRNLLQGNSRVGIVHYAGHACTSVYEPEATVLCLTDGDLTLTEFLEDLPAPPQVMVLSACQTGQYSLLQAPDENLGFASIAIDKGVAIVVGSLWPVADREASRFMKAFYRSLFRSLSESNEISGPVIGGALAEAQRGAGGPDYEKSRHWAAFQAFGV